MYSPGLDLYEWEALEEDLRTDPAQALPELDGLVARMLEDTGYDLTDPIGRDGGEREVVSEYFAAHEIAEAAERDSRDLSLGDVAAAVTGFRAVFDHLVATRAGVDAQLGEPEQA